jgi:hypothetical protein
MFASVGNPAKKGSRTEGTEEMEDTEVFWGSAITGRGRRVAVGRPARMSWQMNY